MDVLADPDGDTARLREPHSNDEGLAAAETLDLAADSEPYSRISD